MIAENLRDRRQLLSFVMHNMPLGLQRESPYIQLDHAVTCLTFECMSRDHRNTQTAGDRFPDGFIAPQFEF